MNNTSDANIVYMQQKKRTAVQKVVDEILTSVVYPCIRRLLSCVTPVCICILRALGDLYGLVMQFFGLRWGSNLVVTSMQHKYLRGEWVSRGDFTQKKITVLYIHGGAFIVGSPLQYRPITLQIAKIMKTSRLLVLKYRKAPEHPFPSGLDDCISAYTYLIRDLMVKPDSIVLMGDSAGGNLAFAVALYCSMTQLPQAGALVGLSPWLNPCTATSTLAKHASENNDKMQPVHMRDTILRMYLNDTRIGTSKFSNTEAHPLVCPMLATDEQLQQLPPLLIQVGAADALMTDCKAFVERVASIQGRTSANKLHIWEGLPHVFQMFSVLVPEAEKSLQYVSEFINQQLM